MAPRNQAPAPIDIPHLEDPVVGSERCPNCRAIVYAMIACTAPLIAAMSLGFTSPALDTMTGSVYVNGEAIPVPSNLAMFEGLNHWAPWFTSLINVGALCGSLAGGKMVLCCGQRTTLGLAVLLMGASWAGCVVAESRLALCLLRVPMGVGVGFQSVATPSLIAYVAPPHLRGRLGTGQSLSICLGVLLSQVLGGSVFRDGPAKEFCDWRTLAIFIASCAAASLLALLFLPAKEDLSSPMASPVRQFEARKEDYCKYCTAGLVAMIMQNMSGIGTVTFFGQGILAEAGLTFANELGDTVTCVQLCGILVATAIIERLGRRPLLLGSCFGMAAGAACLAASLMPEEPSAIAVMLSLYSYVLCFAIGVGPVPWLLLPELGLPVPLRLRLASIATASNWAASFVVTGPPLTAVRSAVGLPGVFFIFSVICCVAFFVLLGILPETRMNRHRDGASRLSMWGAASSTAWASLPGRQADPAAESFKSSMQPVASAT